jgi:hypothetical protein
MTDGEEERDEGGLGGLLSALTSWHTGLASQWETSLMDMNCMPRRGPDGPDRPVVLTSVKERPKRGVKPTAKPSTSTLSDHAPWVAAPPMHIPGRTLDSLSSAATQEKAVLIPVQALARRNSPTRPNDRRGSMSAMPQV